MFVHLNYTGAKGWIFNLVCPGNAMSVSHKKLLLLKSAKVNRNSSFDEVCGEKHVLIAYRNQWMRFYIGVITGKMLKYPPVRPYVDYSSIANKWEIEEAFFKSHNITPHWIKVGHRTLSLLNYTTGQWSGQVGLIQRDEADYAISNFAGTHPRSKVAAFSPGLQFTPYYWYTRYPLELTPMWNLLGLFTKGYNSLKSKLNLI